MLSLDRQEYVSRQNRAIAHATRKRSVAEMCFTTKQQREISAIRSAVHNLESGTLPTVRHRAIQSIAIARAVHNTLLAKRTLAYERLNEAKLQMQVSQDEIEDVQNHIALSEQQVGRQDCAADECTGDIFHDYDSNGQLRR